MAARVLFVGLDAVDATVVSQLAANGDMPALAALATRGLSAWLDNHVAWFPSSIWYEIVTGQSVASTGRFYEVHILKTGEARFRSRTAEEMGRDETFWRMASDAGRRVAAIDIPHTVLDTSLNGIQVVEWGNHDRIAGEGSFPPEILREIFDRFGRHPVRDCDLYRPTHDGYGKLLDDLRAGLERKTAFAEELLSREDWDLFAIGLAEGHCAGHHFWHLHDPAHREHDPSAPAALHGALKTVYKELDRAVGRFVEAAGQEAEILVMASHGMNANRGGVQLLPEILARLGASSAVPSRLSSALRRINGRIKHFVPRRHLNIVRRIARGPVTRTLQERAGCLVDPFASETTRAAAVGNNGVGAIRLNLRGRDPFGAVAEGNEAMDMLEGIRDALLELRDPDTDTPIVRDVKRVSDLFGENHCRDLPDLVVQFAAGLGCIEAGRSRRLGLVAERQNRPLNPRTGDHTDVSCIWATGPRLAHARRENGHVLDIAPTILKLLAVGTPSRLDGRSLV